MNEHTAPMAQETGRNIREARLTKGLTQEKLAEEVDVDDRTVRMWESGERSPSFDHRKELVRVLSIQPELLGLQKRTDFLLEEALSLIKHTKLSFDQGAVMSVRSNAGLLVRNLSRQVKRGDVDLFVPLIHSLYLRSGLLLSVDNNISLALDGFKQIKSLASKIGDQTWLCIALTYQAEIYRRMGDYQKALRIFKKAPRGQDVDIAAIGNYQQFLARLYVSLNDFEAAKKAMCEAEKCALMSQGHSNDLYIFFDLCSVYVDYAHIHMKLGDIRNGLNYIDKAEEELAKRGLIAPYWLVPIQLLKAELLLMIFTAHTDTSTSKSILDDPDYLEGARLVVETYKLAREYGDQRQIRSVINHFWERGNRNIKIAQDLEERLHDIDS